MSKQITVAAGDTLFHVRVSAREFDDNGKPKGAVHLVVQDDRGGAARWLDVDSADGQRFLRAHPEVRQIDLAPVHEEDEAAAEA